MTYTIAYINRLGRYRTAYEEAQSAIEAKRKFEGSHPSATKIRIINADDD